MSDRILRSPLFSRAGPYANPNGGDWEGTLLQFFRGCADRAAEADRRPPPRNGPIKLDIAAAPAVVCACVTGSGESVAADLRVTGQPHDGRQQFAVRLYDWPVAATELPVDCRVYLLAPELVGALKTAAKQANIADVFHPDRLDGNFDLVRILSAAPVLDGTIDRDGKLNMPAFLLPDDFPDEQRLPRGTAIVLVTDNGSAPDE